MGIQDDAWLRWGPGTLDERLTTLDGLGVGTVRFTLVWGEIAQAKPAERRGTRATRRTTGRSSTRCSTGLHAHGITPLVTIWGAPKWSNGGHPANWLPTQRLRDFAYAAAKRYPWVRLWTVWNEPNTACSRGRSRRRCTCAAAQPGVRLLHRAKPRTSSAAA